MSTTGEKNTARFGHTELPEEQQRALRKAVKWEWITIGFLVVSTFLVYLVLGNSQAMKAAWIEDLLSFLPPISLPLPGGGIGHGEDRTIPPRGTLSLTS